LEIEVKDHRFEREDFYKNSPEMKVHKDKYLVLKKWIDSKFQNFYLNLVGILKNYHIGLCMQIKNKSDEFFTAIFWKLIKSSH
jgi:hypothetical protein